MKIKIWIAALLLCAGVTACYDDSKLWEELGNHEERIQTLETLCSQMNTNISSLQTIVTALQTNDYITAVVPINEGDKVIGYTVTFSKLGSITIYHGKDGADGKDGVDGKDGADGKDGLDGADGKDGADGQTPVIGVRQDTDGIWYWVLNGEWLLDDDGNKIKAVGTDGQDGADGKDGENGADGADGEDGQDGKDGVDGKDGLDGADGKDGITPELKIEDGWWYVSYDDGATWTQLGKATGEDGKNSSAECIFKDVEDTGSYLKLTLADGSVITLNKNKALSINFEGAGTVKCIPETTVTIPYTITGAEGASVIAVICQGKWEAEVEQTDNMSGNIHVHVPSNSNSEKVTVVIYNSGRTHMVDLVFGLFFVVSRSGNGWDHDFSEEGHTIILNIKTNVDYTVSIPEEAQDWISYATAEPVKSLSEESIWLYINENHTPDAREATVRFVDEEGVDVFEPYEIRQNPGFINFASPQVEAVLVNSSVNTDGDSRISYSEATAVRSLGDANFRSISEEWTFNEFEMFTSVEAVENSFKHCNSLKEITLPQSTRGIGEEAFYGCHSLESIHIPASVSEIGSSAFSGCGNLTLSLDEANTSFVLEDGVLYDAEKTRIVGISCTRTGHLEIPSSVESSGFSSDMRHAGITSVTIPSTWTEIPYSAFSNWTALESIEIPSSVTRIGYSAFLNCPSLESIEIPSSVTEIDDYAFCKCLGLTEINLPEGLEILSECLFNGCNNLTTLTLPESLKAIEDYIFGEFDNITNIHIPANVEYIAYQAFCWSKNLTITVDEDNQQFCSDENAVYTKDMTGLIYVNPGIEKDYVIPASVTEMGYLVFHGNELSSVTVHSDVESVGNLNFWFCTGCDITLNMLGTTPPSLSYINEPESGSFKIMVPESAYETYLAAETWGLDYISQFLTYDGMKIWSINGVFEDSGNPLEITLTRTTDHFIIRQVYLSDDVRFRFVCDGDTDNSYGAAVSDADDSSVLTAEFFTEYDLTAGGADICIPAGRYDIILAKDLGSFTILPNTWRITGTFNDWGENDIPMKLEDGWYVAYDIEWSENTGFKFWYDRDWGKGDFGVSYSYIDINTRYPTSWSGNDIYVPAGRYDIYLSESADIFYVMTAGQTPPQLQQ